MTTHEAKHEPVPIRVYVGVWLALLVLTVITVGVSFVDMKHVTVLTAMLIASLKGLLVLLYFMHIRYDNKMYIVMILAAFLTYAVFIGLTFADYSFR